MGCCALSLTFGLMAGVAHVHESADHHTASAGVHLDHIHVDEPGDHGHDHGTRDEHDPGPFGIDILRAAHHEADVVYLEATAVRPAGSSLRLISATVSAGETVDPDLAVTPHADGVERPLRDPLPKIRSRPRAPPA